MSESGSKSEQELEIALAEQEETESLKASQLTYLSKRVVELRMLCNRLKAENQELQNSLAKQKVQKD